MRFEPTIGDDGKVYAYLTTDELAFNKGHEYDPLLTFPVHTYDKLNSVRNKDQPNEWLYVFEFVNGFFDTLTLEEKELVAKTYIISKKAVDRFQEADDISKLGNLTSEISGYLEDMDTALDFCTKLYDYVVQHVPIGMMPDAGKRPQDREELTFREDDVKLLNTITVLCKILCPIFGSIIKVARDKIASSLKEQHCASIMTGIIRNRYLAVTEKLRYYVDHVTRQTIREDDASAFLLGHDMNTLGFQLYCQLLVRQLVNIDLAVNDSNLMSYIIVSVKRSAQNTQGAVSGSPTKPRKPPETDSDDAGNTALIETDSVPSKKQAWVLSVIRAAVPVTVRRIRNLYGILESEYNQCLEYYESHPFTASLLSQQLTSLMYGKDLDGSKCVQSLKFDDFKKLTILLQMIIMSHRNDPAFHKLAHLMTAVRTINTSVVGDEVDNNIISVKVQASEAFRQCKMEITNSTVALKNREWKTHIQMLIESITRQHYVYNTSDMLWAYLQEENQNGKPIELDSETMIAYCQFYIDCMNTQEEAAKAVQL